MRRHWLDNLRWVIILLVVVHHLICFFNSAGVPMNVNAPGIPALDAVAYFCYPWLMPCMFLLAGISARYALEERGTKGFLKSRARKLLPPFVGGVLLLGIPLVWLSFAVKGGSVAEMIAFFPSPVVALFFLALMGMGPQWFLLELFVITLLFLPLVRLDREDRLWSRCGEAGLPGLLALALPFWACSQVLNATNRHLVYGVVFLLGYFVCSHEAVQARLRRAWLPLLALALGLSLIVQVRWFGRSFADAAFIEDWASALFAWCMTLAAVGCALAWLDRETPLTAYCARRGFAVYQFHYLALSLAVWAVTGWLDLPAALEYLLSLSITLAVCLGLYEALSRIPGVNALFALKREKRE